MHAFPYCILKNIFWIVSMPAERQKTYWYYFWSVETWAIILLVVAGVIYGSLLCVIYPSTDANICEVGPVLGFVSALYYIPVTLFFAPFLAYYLKRRKDYKKHW